jgi:hypothetical protein
VSHSLTVSDPAQPRLSQASPFGYRKIPVFFIADVQKDACITTDKAAAIRLSK